MTEHSNVVLPQLFNKYVNCVKRFQYDIQYIDSDIPDKETEVFEFSNNLMQRQRRKEKESA